MVRLGLSVALAVSSHAQSPMAAAPAQSGQPNLVVILADDFGIECVGCYGGESYATPALDRLARQGVRFAQCHTQPLCTPTRVELLTGLHNTRNYEAFSVLPRGARTFAQILREHGYRTGAFGKWQLLAAENYPESTRGSGSKPQDAGFDRHCLWQVDKLGSRYRGPLLCIDGDTIQFDDGQYGPDVCAEALLSFVEEAAADAVPFVAFWPMILPHDPFEEPPPFSGDKPKRGKQHFAAMVATVDRLVGRFAQRLEVLGLAENTVVLFIGDNGTSRRIHSSHSGKQVRGGKKQPGHSGTHVPMIAWGRGIASASVVEHLVCTRDVLPTLCSLSGAQLPAVCDGVDLAPLLGASVASQGDWRQALAFDFWPRPIAQPRTQPVRFAIDARLRLGADGVLTDREGQPVKDAGAQLCLQRALDALPRR